MGKLKKLIIDFAKEYNWHLLILSTMILIIFFPFIFKYKDFFIGSDQKFQYNPFMSEWLRLLKDFFKTGEFPFYSWYKFLGSDFYSSASYYVTGDIFVPILILFDDINYAMLIETIILIYISSFSFRHYISEFGIQNKNVRTLSSIVYSFSGIALLYFANYMFHRFYAFLPLLFLGVELAIKKNKFLLFALSVSLLFFSSIYFMFPTSIFLIVYTLISLKMNNKLIFSKKSWQLISKLISFYLIAFGLTAFFSFPSLLSILGNARVGDNWDNSIFWTTKVILGLFFSNITGPLTLFNNLPNMFIYGEDGHATFYSIFLFSSSLPILFTFFIKLKDNNKKYLVLLYVFILIAILFKPINSIMHGFSIPSLRFVFLYVFTSILIIAYTLDRYSRSFKYGLGIFISLFTICTFVALNQNIFDYSVYSYQINAIFIMFLVAIFSTLLKSRKLLYSIIIIEITISSFLVLKNDNEMFYKYEPSINVEYMEYYQSIDEDYFYRIYVNPEHLLPTNLMNLNHSLELHYFSVMSYDTNYEANLHDFIRLNNFEWHLFDIENPEILRMLGVKYFMVFDEIELPTNFDFNYVYDMNFLKVFKLNNYRPLGFTYSNFADIASIDLSWNNWNSICLLESADIEKTKDILPSNTININLINRSNNSLDFHIDLSSKQLVFLSIPYNNGWSIYEDKNELDYIKVNGGFIGIILEPGYHNIHMQFIPLGFKEGVYVTFVSIGVVISIFIFRSVKRKNVKKKERIIRPFD